MPSPTRYVYVDDCLVLATTDAAIQIVVKPGRSSPWYWVPKSQLHADSIGFSEDTEHAESGQLIIPEWLADDKDIPWNDYYSTEE